MFMLFLVHIFFPSKEKNSIWEISIFSDLLDKMASGTKLEDKLEAIWNFQAWKYRVGLILRENDLNKYIKAYEVAELEEDESKEKH